MIFSPVRQDRFVRTITISAVSLMICWGLVVVCATLKPFGIDEWRIIYNLKYKDAAALWGPLDFVQQFPRVYLEIIKVFTSIFDYSYFALRLPSFLTGVATMLVSFKLMNKIFSGETTTRFLFVLIIMASPAFFEYYVQVKQYTMDILLSLVAIWQLLLLADLINSRHLGRQRYLLLCCSFLIAPFFSYTYAIVISPIFFIVVIHTVKRLKGYRARERMTGIVRLWVPLALAMMATVVFYFADAEQVMKDGNMQQYWAYLMMQQGFKPGLFFTGFYNLFALAGSGLIFEILFGSLGILAFLISLIGCARCLGKKHWATEDYINLYCTGLVIFVLLLFAVGKLPLGERRLSSFSLPVVAILIVSVVSRLQQIPRSGKWATAFVALLFIGVSGSIITSPVNELLDPSHKKSVDIYVNTENAITTASLKKIPIFVTSGIAYPSEKMINFPHTHIQATAMCMPPQYVSNSCTSLTDNMPGDWILKAFPAYKVSEKVTVYALNDLGELKHCMLQLSPDIKSVMAGDGNSFREIIR